MKNLVVLMVTAVSILVMEQAHANEALRPEAKKTVSVEKTQPAEVQALIDRVNEINAMDKSSLTTSEKKELRKELRTIKSEANAQSNGGVIYISGGLILLIVLLIILL
jgi:hypothetical protein